jgi:hypothetical protein
VQRSPDTSFINSVIVNIFEPKINEIIISIPKIVVPLSFMVQFRGIGTKYYYLCYFFTLQLVQGEERNKPSPKFIITS